MRKFKYIALVVFIAFVGSNVYAQSDGELNRFRNENLTIKNDVKIYPNPSVDFLQVKIENTDLESISFTVHNIIGNTVNVDIQQLGNNEFRLRVEDLAPGYYLLAIKDDKNLFKETYKFLKR